MISTSSLVDNWFNCSLFFHWGFWLILLSQNLRFLLSCNLHNPHFSPANRTSKRTPFLNLLFWYLNPYPLFGQDKIALRVAKVLNKYQANKYYTLDIKESEFSYQRREELIAQEIAKDGIYIIRTSVEKTVMDAPTTVKAYKSRSQVESAFRCYKSIDLKVRPIYHYNPLFSQIELKV